MSILTRSRIMLIRLQKHLICRFLDHLKVLYSFCDPLQSFTIKKNVTPTAHLYVPMFVIIWAILHGTLGLHWEATGSFTLIEMFDGPYIFTHQVRSNRIKIVSRFSYFPSFLQISPSFVWSQMDFALIADGVTSVAILVALLLTPTIKEPFQLCLIQDKLYIGKKGIKKQNTPSSFNLKYKN